MCIRDREEGISEKKEWISLFIGNRTCDFLKRNECGFRDKANPSFGTINILNLRSLGSVLNELLHWFRAARRGTVKASVGDQNVSRVRWVKRGSRKGFWCEFFWFVYLSQPLLENLKIDLHLPLSHYTFSSLFHFTELSNTFSRIHPRYSRNWSYWSVVLFSIGTCCCLGWFESRHCLYIQNRRRVWVWITDDRRFWIEMDGCAWSYESGNAKLNRLIRFILFRQRKLDFS